MTKQQLAYKLNECEDILLFMSVNSLVTDSEKIKIRSRMSKYWNNWKEVKNAN